MSNCRHELFIVWILYNVNCFQQVWHSKQLVLIKTSFKRLLLKRHPCRVQNQSINFYNVILRHLFNIRDIQGKAFHGSKCFDNILSSFCWCFRGQSNQGPTHYMKHSLGACNKPSWYWLCCGKSFSRHDKTYMAVRLLLINWLLLLFFLIWFL